MARERNQIGKHMGSEERMSDDLSPSLIAFAENEWGEFWTANERLSLAEFAAIARAEGRAETEALRAEIAQHMQAAQAEVARLRAAIQEFGKGEGADFRAAVVRACDERIDAYKHEAREARREVDALRQLAMKNASTMEVARRRLRGDFGAKTSELNMAIDETRAALAAAKEKAGDPKAAGQVHAEARPDVKG